MSKGRCVPIRGFPGYMARTDGAILSTWIIICYGKLLGVSPSTIRKIRRRELWNHVERKL